MLNIELSPLTRCRPSGETLTRRPEIESSIRETLELDWNELSDRLKVSDPNDERFVKEEVLVFLLRETIAGGYQQEADQLSQTIFDRVEERAVGYARKLVPAHYFEEAVADMLGDFFMKISDLNSNAADFSQVRFWLYLKRICGERWIKYQAQGKIEEKSLFLDQPDRETGQTAEIKAPVNAYNNVDFEDLKKGLNVLPEPHRTAFILRHARGWQIESINPYEMTISRHFGKTERTIRSWLAQAEEILKKWRREQTAER